LESGSVADTPVSYKNGKYLIVDVITNYSYIGNQTDYGSCITFFLERVEK
jgi:hypothetical protein